MKLTCDFDISDRLLPSFNMKSKNRAVHAQLSVGCKPGSASCSDKTVFLLVCTAKNRAGTKYQLKDNIENFFTKFINEGKATVRLKKPEHDLVLSKADPLILKSFLSVVRAASLGKHLDRGALSTLVPATNKQIEKPKTRLAIVKRKDYPVRNGFPPSLEQLNVNTCNLKRIDTRILQLKHLKVLDLSSNVIEVLPADIGKLSHLTELRLCDNKIVDFPIGLMQGSLQSSLQVLDLRKNQLRGLNPMFGNFINLVNLKLDDNELICLPSTIGKMSSLKYFSASRNSLKALPASFAHLRFENLDLFGNKFERPGAVMEVKATNGDLYVPSLVEVAARAVKKHRLTYTIEDLPGNLYRMLENGKVCVCRQWCFQSFAPFTYLMDLRLVSHTVVGLDHSGTTFAPLDGFLCSRRCLDRFVKNPNAYWKVAAR